jgi:hypothetical protein
MAETVLQYSVRKTKDLFARRPSAEDWARNLLEGSKRLKTKHDWDKFYTFITNPEAFEEGEIPDHFSQAKISEGIPTDYPPHMKVVKIMNGNETMIHVVNTRKRGEDDEKSPC